MAQERPLADDTPLDAERRQFEVWSRMTPTEKMAALEELLATAAALAEAGIRRQFPHASDREVFLRRVARTLDRQTMIRCYGWDPDEAR